MSNYVRRVFLCVLLSVLLLLLSACSFTREGTIPRGTPDTGSGTPAVLPTTSSTQSVPVAPPNTTGNFYTFVRNKQLWVALNGAKPEQVTHFDYTQLPDVFWHQPLWSTGDRFIAFITDANPVGLGGGGCPGPDYAANGVLYVMNTNTMQFTQITLPTALQNATMNGSPRTDYWQYVFWEDATHIFAWYNGVPGKTSGAAGLYRYDLTTQAVTQVLSLQTLGVGTLFAPPQKDVPLLLSMRYSNGQLFYEAVVHPFGQQSQLMIYSHSLFHPEVQSKVVINMGSEAWCATAQPGPFIHPGWDIAPDGEQLVVQMVTAGNSSSANQGVSTVQALNLTDGSTTGLLSQAPTQLMARDLILTWGPDSQTVVATSTQVGMQQGPYSASLANPTALQRYAPIVASQVAWRSDSGAFALQSVSTLDTTLQSTVYVFLKGDTQGRMLLGDAQNFTWG